MPGCSKSFLDVFADMDYDLFLNGENIFLLNKDFLPQKI